MNVSVSSVSGQSSDNFQTIREIIQNPERFSNSHNIGAIIEKLDKNMSVSCLWDEVQRGKERRQALWVIAIVLFVDGWYNSQNRQRVINIMREWKIDDSVFWEMKDTAETYRTLSNAHVDDWDVKRSEEVKRNKNNLDKSIKDLIELG